MITWIESRSGVPTFLKDDKSLGSRIDPIKEAHSWVDEAVRKVGTSETLVILGCGTGFHCRELMSRRARQSVIVIEKDQEIVEAALAVCQGLNRDQIVCEEDWTHLVSHWLIRNALGGRCSLLPHGPSYQFNREYFLNVEKLFLGRDLTSFLIQLQARPDMEKLFTKDDLESLGEEPISIKTLQSLLDRSEITSTESRIWKVLGELIA